MGAAAAVLVFVVFFLDRARVKPGAAPPVVVVEDRTPVPTIDPEVLAQVRDGTRLERIQLEKEPLAHLLEKSLGVVPAVTAALGMPAEPVPAATIQANPSGYRGAYLWYKGELLALSPPKDGHPVVGFRIYDAVLRTAAGEHVLLTFSVAPPSGIQVGDYVRAEGFFLKLRDAHLPVPLTDALHLVGPELLAAHRDWEAVAALDPAILAGVRDGVRENGIDVDLQDATQTLKEGQDVPLWHIAGYARHREKTLPPEELQKYTPFDQREQFNAIIRDEYERGAPHRLTGTVKHVRVVEAKPNPLGVQHWSEVWLLNRNLGTATFAVWIPEHVGDWQLDETAVCYGYFFRRHAFLALDGKHHMVPLFVAANLKHWSYLPNQSNRVTAWAMVAVFLALVALCWSIARRDGRARKQHEAELVQRRQTRRARTQQRAVSAEPSPSAPTS
jgi:hypothetical protein